MPYTLSWHMQEKLIDLRLEGQLSVNEMKTISQDVMNILDDSQEKMHLLIDAMKFQSSYHTADQLRNTQKYMDHSRLDFAVLVTDNKLNRLTTLMAFCMARVPLMQFDSFSKAKQYLERRGFEYVGEYELSG